MSDYSEWAEQAYADFVKLGRDTASEKIKENRDKFLPHCRKAKKLKKVKDHEAFRLCDQWIYILEALSDPIPIEGIQQGACKIVSLGVGDAH